MPTARRLKLLTCAAVLGLAGPAGLAVAAGFTPGQSVQVREGDTWSSASVVKREGRKYLIHYAGSDASSDEWVGPDRIKEGGTPAPAATPIAPPPAAETPAEQPVAPVRPRPPARHAPKAETHDGPPAEVIPQLEPDRSALDGAASADAPTAWGVTPDPAAKPTAARSVTYATPSAIPEDDTSDNPRAQQMSPGQLLPCRDGGAIIGFEMFGEKGRAVVRAGTTTPSAHVSLPTVSLPMSASPSGAVLVCRCKKFGFGNNGRVDVYTIAPGHPAATPLVSFTPYPDNGIDKPEDVRFTAALSDSRILTCDLKGRLTAWDIAADSVRGVWRADVGPDMHFGGDDTNDAAVSPGGKWVAAAGHNGVSFVDAATGRVAGVIDTGTDGPLYDLCWSPSGRTVMARGKGGLLFVLDATAGRQVRAVPLPTGVQSVHAMGGVTIGGGDGGQLACVDDGFALMGGHTLVDAATGAAVPSFQSPVPGSRALAATGAGVTLLATETRLTAAQLPTEQDKARVASGADLALKPGMSVVLDENLDGLSDADRSSVDRAIRKKLTDAGFQLATSADTTVVVRTEPGQQHEYYYAKSSGRFPMMLPMLMGGGTSIIVTEKVTRVTIQQKGQPIWEQRRVSQPAPRIEMKDGQSMEDAVKNSVTYDAKFLENVTIPPYIAKPASDATPPPRRRVGRMR